MGCPGALMPSTGSVAQHSTQNGSVRKGRRKTNTTSLGKSLWKTTGEAKGRISKEKGKASIQSVGFRAQLGGQVSERIDFPFKPRAGMLRAIQGQA